MKIALVLVGVLNMTNISFMSKRVYISVFPCFRFSENDQGLDNLTTFNVFGILLFKVPPDHFSRRWCSVSFLQLRIIVVGHKLLYRSLSVPLHPRFLDLHSATHSDIWQF